MKSVPEWRNFAQKLGIRILAGPLVNNEHMLVCIVEASEVEIIDEFVNQSGIQQWNTVKIIPSSPIEEAIKKYDHIKPII